MQVELKRWDKWNKGRIWRAVLGVLVGAAFVVWVLLFVDDFDRLNRPFCVLFGIMTMGLGAWGLNLAVNPNKLDCMEVVKGEMDFEKLKHLVEAEDFAEPLCFWNFSKGEKSGYRLLVSDNWLLLGATMDGLVCIPKDRVAKVVDACFPRKVDDGEAQEAHFIDIFLDDGKEYLPGFACQEGDASVADILRECFPNAEINASPTGEGDFAPTPAGPFSTPGKARAGYPGDREVFQPMNYKSRWPMYLGMFGVAVWTVAVFIGFIFYGDALIGDAVVLLFLLGSVLVFAASVAHLVVNGQTMTRKQRVNIVVAIILAGIFLAFMCVAVYFGSMY